MCAVPLWNINLAGALDSKMVDILIGASRSEVKSKLGVPDSEWRIFETEARYEYNSNFETYNPAITWTNIKLDEKRKSIARLKSKCHEKNVTWGESAAEWILHNLHQSAMKTDRNQKKKLASIVAEPNNASSPTRASGTSAMYDPVRDVLS